MQSLGIVAIAVAVGLATGCLLGTQPSANGQLGRHLEHPLQASMISFASGAAIVLALSLAAGVFPPRLTVSAGQMPWWVWTGGAIGVVMVTTSLIFVPRVGSLIWFAAVMTGQTVAAIVLDHYGWMGNPRSSASPLRLVGAMLLIGGVIAIVQAKRLEANAEASSDRGGGKAFPPKRPARRNRPIPDRYPFPLAPPSSPPDPDSWQELRLRQNWGETMVWRLGRPPTPWSGFVGGRRAVAMRRTETRISPRGRDRK